MKKILIIILMVLCAASVFADFKFSGGAKIVWSYDFKTGKFTSSGRDGNAAVNMVVKATGDFYSITLQGPLYSRSSTTEGINGRITLKAIKLLNEFDIEFETIKSLDIYAGNSVIRSNIAYADPMAHDDGSLKLLIATNTKYLPYGLELGLENLVIKTGMTLAAEHQEYGFNVLGKFFDGALVAEAGYAYNSETEEPAASNDKTGHKFADGGNGNRIGTSFALDIAKLAGSEEWSTIVSADVQLNLDNKEANAYYAAGVVQYRNWFAGLEYKYTCAYIDDLKDTSGAVIQAGTKQARITGIEGKVRYTFDTKHKPTLYATAGYMLERKDLLSDYSDKGFMCSVGGTITVKEMTVKVEYRYAEHEWYTYPGSSKLNFEINFKF